MTGAPGQNCPNQKSLSLIRFSWLKLLFCGYALMATIAVATATPNVNADSPADFFTNVASRLLSSELNLDLTRIQIYPTNQYTPAVHRLLQVAANVYDAMTNRYYDPVLDSNSVPLPTVFQPVFGVEGGCVYITNYVEVTDTSFLTNTLRSLNGGSNVVANLQPNDLIFGVPLIIGARKGFPNFNKFAMESAFQLVRRLQVTRPSTNSPVSLYQCNQMFLLSITNQLGVECWNSYGNDYTRPVAIYANDYMSVTLANDEGFSSTVPMICSGSLPIPNATNGFWPGYNPIGNPLTTPYSFQIPLNISLTVTSNSTYVFNAGGTPFLTSPPAMSFETNVVINGSSYPQPHWSLLVTNNLQVIMVDATSGRVIDYVQLSGPNGSRDPTAEITNNEDAYPYTGINGMWEMGLSYQGVPFGIVNQISVSLGLYVLGGSGWDTTDPSQVEREIDGFRVFYHLAPMYFPTGNYGAAATATSMQVPYTPIATAVQHISWQANDPLVHYLASDLGKPASRNFLDRNRDWPANLGQLNDDYFPWGGNPLIWGADPNPYNFAIKDPLVSGSDYWNFPTNAWSTAGWLGRVHRGTPWQTIFLKATNILAAANGLNIWENWTGDLDATDAAALAPAQDWHVASLLASMLNTNDVRTLLSVNNPDPNAWLSWFDGLTALTNLSPGVFATIVISSNSPQASVIANAIQSARAGQPGGFFRDMGDILVTPQLTVASPFLNLGVNQLTNGISDEAYEIIPGQLLSLLRADSVGSITSTNSQMLVRFTGYDGYAYAIEVSSNLVAWAGVITNCPANGNLVFTNPVPANANPEFYRSVLLP
jgi:hypothetical protein